MELVIFDCDGVLVDTEHLAVRLQIALGAELGRPLTADEVVERFIGRSKEAILGQLTERLGARTAGLWWSPLVRRHREAVDLGLDPVDGLPEALAALTAVFHDMREPPALLAGVSRGRAEDHGQASPAVRAAEAHGPT
ncbi:HAD hydrolase-like protein [Streptomyces omiyaensis]|uniref:HAD hydrolase-like protein n=1 Tax=Streptomyces omiyaensis TaxID=68247 RepID=UPI003700B5B2